MTTGMCLAVLCALLGSGIATEDGRATPDTLTRLTGVQRNDIPVTNSRYHQFTNPYVSELWMLGNKMTRVEDKFQTFGDRVDIKLDSLRKRATSLENHVLERVASVETDFSSRVSRLEDRLASVILSKSQEPEPDESKAIATIKDDLTEVTRSVEMLNISQTDLQQYRLKEHQLTANLSARISNLEDLGSPDDQSAKLNMKSEIRELRTSLNTLNESVVSHQEDRLKELEAATNLSRRFSRLEEAVSSIEKPTSSDSCPDECPAFRDMERKVEEMAKSLETCLNVTQLLDDTQTRLEEMNQTLQTLQVKRHLETKPGSCERGMGTQGNKTFPPYVIMKQHTIQRDVLCDTKTDGGGWVIIQRRTNGDVYFNRGWRSYKEGFGKLDGDFWLGNQAVHILTYVRPYELMIQLQSDGKEYVARYTTFKLEDEADKYRIRLGSVSGTLGGSGYGLSYSNNMAFSTFDSDNDNNSGSCAISRESGWWYKNCNWSKLNAPWRGQHIKEAWYPQNKWLSATRTEMKIRPL